MKPNCGDFRNQVYSFKERKSGGSWSKAGIAANSVKSDRLGAFQFGLQPAQEAGQRQQQCRGGGRQHLGKKEVARRI